MTTMASSGEKRITVILRIVIGGVFMVSCIHKIAHPAAFAAVVANYQILPPALVTVTAIVFPWIEAVCGLALAFGRFDTGAALLVCLMMIAFIGIALFNAYRGLNVACGCFSLVDNEPSDIILLILRDIAILAAGIVVLVRPFMGRTNA
jgi:uncharacterized membrane protein YphA (DoxX/SURF4 family)